MIAFAERRAMGGTQRTPNCFVSHAIAESTPHYLFPNSARRDISASATHVVNYHIPVDSISETERWDLGNQLNLHMVEVDRMQRILGNIDFFNLSGVFFSDRSTSASTSDIRSDLPKYLLKIYALEAQLRHRAASKIIFAYVENKFSKSDLSAVNELLINIDLSRLDVWAISGLLRATSKARSHLPSWEQCFRNAKKMLAGKGHNVNSLFAGL